MKYSAQTKPNFEPPKSNQPNNVPPLPAMELAKDQTDETSPSVEIPKTRFASGEFTDITQSELKAMHTLNEKLRRSLSSRRDLLSHKKHVLTKLARELEDRARRLGKKTKNSEKLRTKCFKLDERVREVIQERTSLTRDQKNSKKLTNQVK